MMRGERYENTAADTHCNSLKRDPQHDAQRISLSDRPVGEDVRLRLQLILRHAFRQVAAVSQLRKMSSGETENTAGTEV